MASHFARTALMASARLAARAAAPAPAPALSSRSLFAVRTAAAPRPFAFSCPLVAAPARSCAPRSVRMFSTDKEVAEKLEAMQPPPLDGEERNDPKINALVDQVVELSMMETMLFMRALQKRLGITDEMLFPSAAAAPAAGAAAAAAPAEGDGAAADEPAAEPEKKAFTVKITELGAGRVKVMKEIRTLTGFGLKEVQALANNLPANVGENLDQEKADKWAEALKKAGATVEVV